MELFKLFGNIAIDNTEANRAIDETTGKAKDGESKTSNAFSKIGSAAGKIATGVGVAGAAMGGAFIAAVEGTREYRQQMGLLDSSFQTAGHSSEEAKNTYSDLNAVIGDTEAAVEASQHIALLADNEKDMQKWTDICTGVYATFGASLPIEGLTEAANHTAKVGEVQGSLADALEWSGISVDDFNEELAKCSSEEERQKLITDTLNKTYKDASAQYKETNKDVMESRKAQERLSDAMAEIGKVGEPIMTAFRNIAAALAEKLVPAIETMIEKVREAAQWVKENKDTIQTWIGVILGAGVAIGTFLLLLNWGTIMSAAANAIKGVRTAILAMNAAMLANPVAIIIAVLAGLVVAFIYLWNNVDGFRQFWIDAWEAIKKAASVAKEWVVNAWNNIGEWFSDKFDKIKQAGKTAMDNVKKVFSDAWNAIKKVWDFVKPYFDLIWNNIKSIFKVVKSVLSGNFGDAWNAIKSIWNNYKTFFNGIWSGIKNVFGSVGSWFGNIFQSAWGKIKSAFSGWGSFFSGLWTSVKNKFGDIGTKIGEAMGGAVKKAMNSALGKIESAINKGIGLINSAVGFAQKLGFSVGKVATIKLPRLEEGGVLKRGQVGILEGSGAEAVVPLEKNTGWIDKIADRLNANAGDDVMGRMNRIIELLEHLFDIDLNVYLDSGALVGELTPAIDMQMGLLAVKKNRRST